MFIISQPLKYTKSVI